MTGYQKKLNHKNTIHQVDLLKRGLTFLSIKDIHLPNDLESKSLNLSRFWASLAMSSMKLLAFPSLPENYTDENVPLNLLKKNLVHHNLPLPNHP